MLHNESSIQVKGRQGLLALCLFFLIVCLLWLPFGFKTTGLIEEWDEMVLLKHGFQLFFIGNDSPINNHRVRPFEALPEALAYQLSPDTFYGLNVIAFGVVLLQGVVFFSIIKSLLPGHVSIALAAAVLFIVYPGDTGQYAIRVTHIRAAVLFYLLAVHFLIRYWRQKRLLFLIVMWGCLAVNLMLYEVSYPVVFITPLVLIWLGRGTRRRFILVSLLWYIVPVITGIRTIIILSQPLASYETQVLGPNILGAVSGSSGLANIVQALQHAYTYQFVTGWQESFAALHESGLFVVLAVATAASAGFLCWRFLRQESRLNWPEIRRLLILVAVGLCLVAVGFSPYILSPAHWMQTLRIFLFSLIGSAIAVTIGVFLLSRFLPLKNVLFPAVASLLIGLAMVHALSLQQLYANYSYAQQDVLAQALQQAPHIDSSATLVIFDETTRYQSEWFFGGSLSSPFQYIYGDLGLTVVICHSTTTAYYIDWQKQTPATCAYEEDGLHVLSPTDASLTAKELILPYSAVVMFKYFDNTQLHAPDFELIPSLSSKDLGLDPKSAAQYIPQAFIDTHTPISPHVLQMFQCQPLAACSGITHPVSQQQLSLPTLEFQFNSPIDGTGWRPPEKSPGGAPFRWMTATVSTINLPFKANHDVLIAFRVINQITPDILKSLKLSVNNVPMDLGSFTDRDGATNFHALIPYQVLAAQPGTVHLAFSVDEIQKPPHDPQALGLAFTSLRLEELP